MNSYIELSNWVILISPDEKVNFVGQVDSHPKFPSRTSLITAQIINIKDQIFEAENGLFFKLESPNLDYRISNDRLERAYELIKTLNKELI